MQDYKKDNFFYYYIVEVKLLNFAFRKKKKICIENIHRFFYAWQ